jgi:opacity protein-like surface antigen
MTEAHPASWLPDPFGRYAYRYWNGAEWTTTVSTNGTTESDPQGIGPSTNPVPVAAAASLTTPRPKPSWSTQVQVLVFGGAGLAALGSFLPWVTADIGAFSVTKNGTEGDGVITLILAVAMGLVFIFGRKPKSVAWLVIVLAGLVLAVALYDTVDVSNKADELANNSSSLFQVSASVGIGLWLALAAGVLAFVGGIVALNHSSGAAADHAAPPM